MKAFVRKILLVGVVLAMASSVIPSQPVFAHEAEEGNDHSNRVKTEDNHLSVITNTEDSTTHRSSAETEDNHSVKTTSTAAIGGERLSAAKLRVCERRETVIKSVMTRSRERADRHLKLFTAIAERTKAFYVKQGNTLANYDELVAAADAAKAHAEASLSAVPAAVEFDCNGADPKAAGTAFKAALKNATTDLQAYKAAVKNLVVGVKSAQPKETN